MSCDANRFVTWNINSLKVRLPHVLRYLDEKRPTLVALQELKCVTEQVPTEPFAERGYQILAFGQPTYNGVALIAPNEWQAQEVHRGIPGFADDAARLLAVEWRIPAQTRPLWTVSAYFPNGQAVGSEKFAYKLRWIEALTAWLAALDPQRQAIFVMGDANIAPEARDAHPSWPEESIHVSSAERAAWAELVAQGFTDAVRICHPEEVLYSWWDYRQGAFRRNIGLRIDHILVSAPLARCVIAAGVDREPRTWQRPSDHAPVWVEWLPPTNMATQSSNSV
ncbi:MAG: exodeoxyribonuclease III [Hydrogenophilus thermoluteolus]